ncbi:osmotically inducible protein OsmC [candidate division GN15 bacterium]|jgi:putative redox protein|nr:osmotically inducible protein OsmC [candidate division GN15 bacterium]
MVSVKMSWQGGVAFEGTGAFGHTLRTDVAKKSGGEESGFKATELLLYGMAACTGVDVIRILQKQRQEVTGLEIEVTGHQNEEYPKPFHTVEIKYTARGPKVDPKKLAQAIELSESKYCVVSQTVANETAVKTSFDVIEE